MAKIGNVEFVLISEEREHTSEVSRHPVESGSDIADHVRNEPRVFNIEGIIGDRDWPATNHSRLVKMWKNRDLVDYQGRASLKNCIITSFVSRVDSSSKRGFTFSMTIEEIRIAKPSTVGLLPTILKVDVAEVGNAGRVQAV